MPTQSTHQSTHQSTNESNVFVPIDHHITDKLISLSQLYTLQKKLGGMSINTLLMTAMSRVIDKPSVLGLALSMSGKTSKGNGASGVFYPVVKELQTQKLAHDINTYMSKTKNVMDNNNNVQFLSSVVSNLYFILGSNMIDYLLSCGYGIVANLPIHFYSTTNLAIASQPLQWGTNHLIGIQAFTSLQRYCTNFSYLTFYSYCGDMYVSLNSQPCKHDLINKMRVELQSWL